MTALYLAIGHGIMPNGVYDPGAVHGHLIEHDLARQVVEATVAALHRSGFADFIAETSPANHPTDPDYRGSVIRANQAHAALACEVHFNAGSTSGHGTETLVYADRGTAGAWAHRVQSALNAAVGISNRGVKERPDLWFLRGTNGAAIIPEVAFVDGDAVAIEDHPRLCVNAGEAIARATLAQLGRHYVPPGAATFSATTGGPNRTVHGLANLDEALAYARHWLSTGSDVVTVQRATG